MVTEIDFCCFLSIHCCFSISIWYYFLQFNIVLQQNFCFFDTQTESIANFSNDEKAYTDALGKVRENGLWMKQVAYEGRPISAHFMSMRAYRKVLR